MSSLLNRMTTIQGLVAACIGLGVLVLISADRSVTAQEVSEDTADAASAVEIPPTEETLAAEAPQPERRFRGRRSAPPEFNNFDANDDGQISREEFEAFESTRRGARGPEGRGFGRQGRPERAGEENFERGPRRGLGRPGLAPGREGRGGFRGGPDARFRDGQMPERRGAGGGCDCIDGASQGRHSRDEYSRDRGRGRGPEGRHPGRGHRPPPPPDYRR